MVRYIIHSSINTVYFDVIRSLEYVNVIISMFNDGHLAKRNATSRTLRALSMGKRDRNINLQSSKEVWTFTPFYTDGESNCSVYIIYQLVEFDF